MEKKIKVRKYWGINPKTRVVENKKKYNRAITKQELNKIRKEEDF
jgi:hypothetical protein